MAQKITGSKDAGSSRSKKSLPQDSFMSKICGDADLNRFIGEKLLPDEAFITQCSEDTDKLATFLKEQLHPYSVAKTEKGGSLKKGTAIKQNSDLDLVLFLNDFKDMKDVKDKMPAVLKALEKQIKDKMGSSYVQTEHSTRHAVKIKIRSRKDDDFLDVDILPAYDIMACKTTLQAYDEMAQCSEGMRQFYSVSLEPLQSKFVLDKIKDCSPVKDLIRLTKYWRKTHFEERSDMKMALPTSYFFELLVIYLWEKGGAPRTFSTTKALKDVMECLKGCININIQFENLNYPADYRNKVVKGHQGPFVLDPANPFNDVCTRANAWDEVSEMASLSLQSRLLKDVTTSKNWQ